MSLLQPFGVEQRQHSIALPLLGLPSCQGPTLVEYLPPQLLALIVLGVVGRPRLRIAEDAVGLQNKLELFRVASFPVVWMVAKSKQAIDALNRLQISGWADLEHFIQIDEYLGGGHTGDGKSLPVSWAAEIELPMVLQYPTHHRVFHLGVTPTTTSGAKPNAEHEV